MSQQLVVRKLDAKIVRRLKQRAALAGRSAEEEHRRILQEALVPEAQEDRFRDLKELLQAMPEVGSDEDFTRSKDTPREINFE